MLKLIVARCKNKGIGKNNIMPWYLKADLKRFQALTVGNKNNSIIMGKNTWKSLNKTPLPHRKNIVVSTTMKDITEKWIIKSSLDKAVTFSTKNKFDETWIIGGEKLYTATINTYDLNKIYVTEILEDFDCDTFFPAIPDNYYIYECSSWNIENDITYRYVCYKNKVKPGDFMYNILPYNAKYALWK